MNPMQTLKAHTATQTDDVLMSSLLLLEEGGMRKEEERLTHAVIADTLMARWNVESEFDAIWFDFDFDGTYAEALLIAAAKVAA